MPIDAYVLNDNILSSIPERPKDGHKGTFGRILIVAGSKNMCGASYLSALAAYRSGVGIVEIFAPEENRTILQCLIPEAVLTTYDGLKDFKEKIVISSMLADAILFGPGFGLPKDADKYLKAVLKTGKRMIIDADGLNIISKNPKLFNKLNKDIILTPHLGEFSRLTGLSIDEIKEDRYNIAHDFAKKYGVVLVLKNHETIIVSSDDRFYINKCGNSGMGTAGSGDVLSGIIGALLALRTVKSPICAAAGVYMHAKAGDLAAESRSEKAIIARDIAEFIR